MQLLTIYFSDRAKHVARFDLTTSQWYFTILIEVFANHILAEKTFRKPYID